MWYVLWYIVHSVIYTCDLILARIWLLGLCPFINRVLHLLQSASKRRQASAVVAPRVLTKKRKMITRRVIKKPAPTFPSPSESNTNQVTHHSKTSSLLHTYVLWLTVILFPGCSWRNPQCRKPGSTWDDCNSWCTDGYKQGTSWYSRCFWR